MKTVANYTPIHIHGPGSIGDSVSKIEDIVTKCKTLGITSCSLTEHGNMISFLKFYKACKAANIKPILGCELYVNNDYFEHPEKYLKGSAKKNKKEKVVENEEVSSVEEAVDDIISDNDDIVQGDSIHESNNHLIILSKNLQGMKNCLHLSNQGFYNFYKKPLVNDDMVFKFLNKEDNIVTTACLGSKFNQLILDNRLDEAKELYLKYKEKFGDSFYIEFQMNELEIQTQINLANSKFCKELGIKPIFGLDAHYVEKDDYFIQYLMYVMKSRKTVRTMDINSWFYQCRQLYIKSKEEIYAEIANQPEELHDILYEALNNTNEIASKVENFEIPMYSDNNPKFCENVEDSNKLILEKIKEGFTEKVKLGLISKDKLDIYKARLKREFDLIKTKGYFDYFLILEDIVKNFVEKTGGENGAGRGSAPGCILLWLLGITKIDPIKYDLLFERFVNEYRKDFVDVDLDFSSEHQQKVLPYLENKYGKEKVCKVANYQKLCPKSVVKDLCKIFELDFTKSNILTKTFNDNLKKKSIAEELESALTFFEKSKNIQMIQFVKENTELFVKYGEKFDGMVRQVGRHASGVLISNKALEISDLPLYYSAGEVITGAQEGGEDREITELGYMKLDLLGLKTASVMKDIFNSIEFNYGITGIENKLLLSDLDDPQVYEEFCKGNTRDIFQFGSDSMVSFIKRVQPKNIKDLCAINAGWRPAIIQAGSIEEYIQNRAEPEMAKESCEEIHRDYWDVLKDNYGIPFFQENCMVLLQRLGGFSLAEADKARKSLKLLYSGKNDKNEAFLKMLEKFKTGAKLNGISEDNVQMLLEKLAKYSEYSFNKCLDGNTEIITKTGVKLLKNFIGGETIVSVNPKTKIPYEAKVKCLHKNGLKKLYSIKTICGKEIKSTLDHKFMINSGEMKTLKEIVDNSFSIIYISSYLRIEPVCTFFVKSSLTEVGHEQTYDLEIDDENHNFILSSGLISSNSHSMAYAMNAYICMWLKIHYPYEYYTSLFKYADETEISWFMKDAKLHGVKLNEFAANKVSDVYSVQYDENNKPVAINIGLNLVKGITDKDLQQLKDYKFISTNDIFTAVLDKVMSKRSIESLCRLGFFKELYENSKTLEYALMETKDLKGSLKKKFGKEVIEQLLVKHAVPDYTKSEKINFEKDYLGFYMSIHPFTRNWFVIKKVRPAALNGLITPSQVEECLEQKITLCGVVNSITMKKSKKTGKEYYKVLLEDDTVQVYVTVFQVEDLADVKIGEFVSCLVSKTPFGITKSKGAKFTKYFKTAGT